MNKKYKVIQAATERNGDGTIKRWYFLPKEFGLLRALLNEQGKLTIEILEVGQREFELIFN